ncbi:MAG TPA: hypothetical protein PJ991_05825 [Kiritimatiellia bacterium]|nr:hypothetical protein [Kiritimatiellia bacterium]
MNFDVLFGRLHPVVIHFPIALIVVAAVVEAIRLKWDHPAFPYLVTFLLATGAMFALLASTTGWVFAREYYPPPSDAWMLTWHRWLGITTTLLAGVAAVISRSLADSQRIQIRWLRRSVIWLAAIVLIATAHLGALMVWGADYFDFGVSSEHHHSHHGRHTDDSQYRDGFHS